MPFRPLSARFVPSTTTRPSELIFLFFFSNTFCLAWRSVDSFKNLAFIRPGLAGSRPKLSTGRSITEGRAEPRRDLAARTHQGVNCRGGLSGAQPTAGCAGNSSDRQAPQSREQGLCQETGRRASALRNIPNAEDGRQIGQGRE